METTLPTVQTKMNVKACLIIPVIESACARSLASCMGVEDFNSTLNIAASILCLLAYAGYLLYGNPRLVAIITTLPSAALR